MAIRKSERYSSLWASCDALRDGKDASQDKDYGLVLLFLKYISDQYAGPPSAPLVIPEGRSFAGIISCHGLLLYALVLPAIDCLLSTAPDMGPPSQGAAICS